MPSKGVVDRQRIGQSIIAAARTHAQQVGEQLELELTEIVEEGQVLPDFVELQLQLARYLEMRLNILVAADEAHLEELDDDQDPRLRRDEAAEALYEKLIQLRSTLNGAFGASRVNTLLGIAGPTPRDPLTLFRQATRAITRLREPAPDLPPFQFLGLQFNRETLADELQPATEALGVAIQDVTLELRETETTKGFKDEAIEAFDTAAGGIARVLIGCDELAGFPHFADKIRLTLPARGGRGSSEEGVPGEEAPPAEDPSSSPEVPATASGETSA